jgi:hypothetical protein
MALFTDGHISDVQDLIAYEANLVEVADAEGIDLESKLRLAQSEVGTELGAAALGPGNLYWTGKSAGQFQRFGLDQVVVTQPLKLWHAFQTLAIIYRDAYNRKLNDKYLPKWTEYKELARWAANLLYQTGVGVVLHPVPRAGQPAVDTVPGTLDAMAAYVRVSWLAAEGAEGAPSAEAAMETADNQALRVTPPAAPPGVTGWNVYVGTESGGATRQNSAPLETGQSWVMPATGLVAGAAAGNGQEPDLFKTLPRFLQRG